MKVFYAGDSPVGGPANYLLGILKLLKAQVRHISPAENLRGSLLKTQYDVIILSDFSKCRLPKKSEQMIAGQVKTGTGLVMVGGWGSFSGPYGGWHGSVIEELLPVTCLGRDDRLSFPSGGLVIQRLNHPLLHSNDFRIPPVVSGINLIRPKTKAKVLLTVRNIQPCIGPTGKLRSLKLDQREYPLLVADAGKKIAALATDLAPHWCSGLLDWGGNHRRLPVRDKIAIEVGRCYIRFVSNLIRWLAS